MKLHMFRTVPLSIISSFFTVNTAMVYVIQVCEQDQDRTEFHPDTVRKLSENLYDMRLYQCCVYIKKLLLMDRRTVRNV